MFKNVSYTNSKISAKIHEIVLDKHTRNDPVGSDVNVYARVKTGDEPEEGSLLQA